MEKISIIVPVYNVESYIRKCLNSLINQTYKNLEIILVDDGSTDNSGKICDEYKKQDERIKVIHKTNKGLSDARNKGVEIATGEYIGFIDSDDFIDLDMYEVLYNNMKRENADLSMCGVLNCYEGTNIQKEKEDLGTPQYYVYNSEEALKNILEAKNNSVWAINKLYKKSIFQEVRYPIGKTTEDAFVIVEVLRRCDKIVFTTEKKYYYIHRENSITTKKFSSKNYDTVEAWENNRILIEKYYPNLIELAQFRMCLAYFNVLDKMILASHEIDKKIVLKLRKNYKVVMRSTTFALTRKISMCLLMINTNLYKIVCKMFYKRNKKIYLEKVKENVRKNQ